MRIEKDSMGCVKIPEQDYYGINSARTRNNMSFSGKSLRDYPVLISALADVKKSAAITNLKIGQLPEELCGAIVEACEKIQSGHYNDQFIVDAFHGGGGIGFNMNMNEVIANVANEQMGAGKGRYAPIHPIDHVNAAQSTSDVCHTGLRIALIRSAKELFVQLKNLLGALAEKEKEFSPVQTISRTCLQDAAPLSMGDKFSGYYHLFARRLDNLEKAVANLHAVNLGGTVVGSGCGAPQSYRDNILTVLREVSACDLNLKRNLFDAAQNLDELAQLSAELNLLATGLLKFCKDLRLLSSGPEAGFAELKLPSVQAGSSFFPGKVNPVLPETIIQCAFLVMAHDRYVQAAFEHGELDLNVFESGAGIHLLDAVAILTRALDLLTEHCVMGISVNTQRCEELANSYIPMLVQLKEIVGYSKASDLLKQNDWDSISSLLKMKRSKND